MALAKKTPKTVRRSISVSHQVDSKVKRLAKHQNWSTNQAYESIIEAGLEAKNAEKRRFFEIGERLQAATDRKEIERLKSELAQMVFGI